jgi:hypothetical protein
VQANDSISATDFNISSKEDINVTDIKDADGNSIDLSGITNAIDLSNASLNTDLIIGGGNKITHIDGVYSKTSSTNWDADVTSSKGFTGDGYVIAKIGER